VGNANDVLALVIDLKKPTESRATLMTMLGSMGRALERAERVKARFLLVGREPDRSWHVAAISSEDHLADAMTEVQSKMVRAGATPCGGGATWMVAWHFLSRDADRLSKSVEAGLRRVKREGVRPSSGDLEV
jgi:hypothetical protein